MITTNLEMWGPEEAKAALRYNSGNRPLRVSHVRDLAQMIRDGDWRATHQGVAFDREGRFIDGQHRAQAIIEAGVHVAVLVTRGLPVDAFEVLDRGIVRTNADALRESMRIVDIANLAARIHREPMARRVTAPEARRYLEAIGKEARDLIGFAPTIRKYMSSAGMKLAAVLHLSAGTHRQYVMDVYKALVLLDMENFPPVGRLLAAQTMTGVARVGGNAAVDGFVRGHTVFDPACSGYKKLIVKDGSGAFRWGREILDFLVPMERTGR